MDETKSFTAAPSDAACDAAWDQIMEIARQHALVIETYSGVATLAVPAEQRSHGLREKVLRMHWMVEAK